MELQGVQRDLVLESSSRKTERGSAKKHCYGLGDGASSSVHGAVRLGCCALSDRCQLFSLSSNTVAPSATIFGRTLQVTAFPRVLLRNPMSSVIHCLCGNCASTFAHHFVSTASFDRKGCAGSVSESVRMCPRYTGAGSIKHRL